MAVHDHYPNPFSSISPFAMEFKSKLPEPMFALLLFLLSVSLLSLVVLALSLYLRLKEEKRSISSSSSSSGSTSSSIAECSQALTVDKTLESKLSHLTHSLILEILSSNSPERVTPQSDEPPEGAAVSEGSLKDKKNVDSSGEECGKKKKKKKGKKKQPSSPNLNTGEQQKFKKMSELISSFPSNSSPSPCVTAIQKKIKQQYAQVLNSNDATGLKIAQQVGKFVNGLLETKNELEQRSDTIQRRFTIAKALLHKADRSCFDRLHQQIYKIELEQKRLEEDIDVYNRIQQRLKLSQAYKKLLEVTATMELEASKKLEELEQIADADFGDMSFEELLAQEKKDSYWQKHKKSLRSA